MAKHFDAIVLGVGGVGSSVLFELARRGLSVLGIEQFGVAHDLGSSHGETRAIRKAYFEHPDYVPLLFRAYERWRELEQLCGQNLLFQRGLIEIGPPDGTLIPGVKEASRIHRLMLEDVPAKEFARRFPGFVLPDDSVAVYEPEAGYLLVEECIRQYVSMAKRMGASVVTEEAVQHWTADTNGIVVQTQAETYRADRLVVTAGAWAKSLLQGLSISLKVLRKHLHWYQVEPGSYQESRGSPLFFYETPNGLYYGFPQMDANRRRKDVIKLAEHSGGELVQDPSRTSREKDPEETQRVEKFIKNNMTRVYCPGVDHAVCKYTQSLDSNFIVDRFPQSKNVVFAAGLSGHGFKFASVLGEILTDLAIDGETSHPIEFLGIKRFMSMLPSLSPS